MASGGRRGLFKRPVEDDEEPRRVIKAKPIAPHIAKRIAGGEGFSGRDFVVGSAKSQSEFYGQQAIIGKSLVLLFFMFLENKLIY